MRIILYTYFESEFILSTSVSLSLSLSLSLSPPPHFRCEICSQNDVECIQPLFSTSASLAPSRSEVICEQTRYDAIDSTPALSARLRVVWNNQRTIDNPNNASGTT